LRETAAVFGLGVVGQLRVQLLKLAGTRADKPPVLQSGINARPGKQLLCGWVMGCYGVNGRRHQQALVIFDQKSSTWLACHRLLGRNEDRADKDPKSTGWTARPRINRLLAEGVTGFVRDEQADALGDGRRGHQHKYQRVRNAPHAASAKTRIA
jgi:hypothetical protein